MAETAVILDFHKPSFDSQQGFYPSAVAARLARVPRQTIGNWEKTGIVPRVVEWVDEEGKRVFGYTFEALVYLRLIHALRHEMTPKFPLRKVVNTVKFLRDNFGPPGPRWVQARIVSSGSDLWIQHPVFAPASRGGQMPFEEWLGREFQLLGEREDALLIPMKFMRWVEIKPELRNGMPLVKGTGIETALIHAAFNQSLTVADIRSRYPFLTPAQIAHSEGYERFLDEREVPAA